MISIIVPVYNVEKYLNRCVDSILAQTSKDYEIILVDDGSPDHSSKICDEYADKFSFIKSVHKESGGVASARNYGLQYATGAWIAFVDSDDWIDPEYIECCMDACKENSLCDVILFGYYIDYVENNYSLDRKFEQSELFEVSNIPDAIERMEQSGMFNCVWNKLYSNILLQMHGIHFQDKMDTGEDLLFNCAYFSEISRCITIEKQLYHYMRQGEDTLTKKYDPNLLKKIDLFDKSRVKLYDSLNMMAERYQFQIYRFYYSYVTSAVHNNYSLNSTLTHRQKVSFFKALFQNERLSQIVQMLSASGKVDSFYEKLFIKLYNSKNAALANLVYSLLFWMRNHFKNVYNRFRKNIFQE